MYVYPPAKEGIPYSRQGRNTDGGNIRQRDIAMPVPEFPRIFKHERSGKVRREFRRQRALARRLRPEDRDAQRFVHGECGLRIA